MTLIPMKTKNLTDHVVKRTRIQSWPERPYRRFDWAAAALDPADNRRCDPGGSWCHDRSITVGRIRSDRILPRTRTPRLLSGCCFLWKTKRLLHRVTDHLPREGLLEEIRYTELCRSHRDGTWVITRDNNDRSWTPFRSNPFRDIESATVRQLVVEYVDIKRHLFDGLESISNRLACLNLVLFIGKHSMNDPADCNVVVYHKDAGGIHL